MKLYMLPDTGTVDLWPAWLMCAQEAVTLGEADSLEEVLGQLVRVEVVDGEWVEVKL